MQDALARAARLRAEGRLAEAASLCRRLILAAPKDGRVLHLAALVGAEQGRSADAMSLVDRALSVGYRSPDLTLLHGTLLRSSGRAEEAISALRAALTDGAQRGPVLLVLADACADLGRLDEARRWAEAAVIAAPNDPDAHAQLGMMLARIERSEEAIGAFDCALAIKPAFPAALFNRANVLKGEARYEAAVAGYSQAIAIRPRFPEALVNRANALRAQHRMAEALEDYTQALALDPRHTGALFNLGTALQEIREHRRAAEVFSELLAIRPDFPFALGRRLASKRFVCDWSDAAADTGAVIEAVVAARPAAIPFHFALVCDDPMLQRRCAETWVAQRFPERRRERRQLTPKPRVRIAYLSSDFREHPVGQLAVSLFEGHDRDRFDVIGLSTGPDDGSALRRRIAAAFETFLDVAGKTDAAIAAEIEARDIDVLIDLNGHTEMARTGVLARRPAPVQIAYLGYPGTTGAPYVDYLIADAHVVPPGHEAFFSEHVLRLPGSYLPWDQTRPRPEPPLPRAAYGLPDEAFVLAAFHNPCKITPEIFSLWMELLKDLPGAVLWLRDYSSEASGNLRAAASSVGVADHRLVFAGNVGAEDHLARYGAADVFLDTSPYGGHTTTLEALAAGVPVVTLEGESFPGRVAAGLLRQAGMASLAVISQSAYRDTCMSLRQSDGESPRAKLARISVPSLCANAAGIERLVLEITRR